MPPVSLRSSEYRSYGLCRQGKPSTALRGLEGKVRDERRLEEAPGPGEMPGALPQLGKGDQLEVARFLGSARETENPATHPEQSALPCTLS